MGAPGEFCEAASAFGGRWTSGGGTPPVTVIRKGSFAQIVLRSGGIVMSGTSFRWAFFVRCIIRSIASIVRSIPSIESAISARVCLIIPIVGPLRPSRELECSITASGSTRTSTVLEAWQSSRVPSVVARLLSMARQRPPLQDAARACTQTLQKIGKELVLVHPCPNKSDPQPCCQINSTSHTCSLTALLYARLSPTWRG